MASPEVAIMCVACGSDISAAKGRRLLCTEASSEVKAFWIEIFDGELARRGISPQGARLLTNGDSGRMCRRCFTVYDRCKKLLDSLKKDVCKAINFNWKMPSVFPQQRSLLTVLDPAFTQCHQPLKDEQLLLVLQHLLLLWFVQTLFCSMLSQHFIFVDTCLLQAA